MRCNAYIGALSLKFRKPDLVCLENKFGSGVGCGRFDFGGDFSL